MSSRVPLVRIAARIVTLPVLFSAGFLQAADSAIEEVVVTPNRIPVPLRQVGTSVAVLTAADIQAHGNLALLDVLRQLPGMGTNANGGAGQTSSLRIRGEEGFRTLTILDGMRLSDPGNTQIQPQLEHLLSSGVERVEVLRGPQGLGYGADAGGVLNISSRQSTDGLRGSVDAQIGSFDTRQIAGNASGGNGRADFFLSAADLATAGFNSRLADNVLRDRDGYDNTTLHGRVGINLNDNLRAELVHRATDGDSNYDGCFLPDYSEVHQCLSVYDQAASRAALSWQADSFSHSLSYARTDTDRELFSQGVSSFATGGLLQRWEYVGNVNDLPGYDLVFGADHEVATLDARLDARERANRGYFAEVLSDFSDSWYFTAGARYDDNEDFGSNTSYRLSTAYLLDLANDAVLKFKGSIGTGLRAPSPYEIAYNSGAWSYPPASMVALQQERSKGIEAGVEYLAANGMRLEAVYFDQDVENAIDFDLVSYSGYLQYVGRSNSRGVELSASMPLTGQLSLQANYTFNDTERPDGQQRLRRPRQLLNVGISWNPQPRLGLHAFARSSRDAIDEPPFAGVIKLDDFVVLDLNASYQLTSTLELSGRIENAFDEQYTGVIGYNTAGVAAYVGVRMNFGSL